MWLDNMPANRRDLAVSIVRDARNGDRLNVAGQIMTTPKRLGGVPKGDGSTIHDWNSLDNLQFYFPYEDSVLDASWNSAERLALMDVQGVAASALFPSLGLIWPRFWRHRPDVIAENFAAYNRWIAAFCEADPARLVPVAQTAIAADAALTTDLEKLARHGFRAIMFPTLTVEAGASFDAAHDRFWAAAADLGLLVCVHKASIPDPDAAPMGGAGLSAHAFEVMPGVRLFADIFDKCMVERHPGLRFAFLEFYAGWTSFMLDRMDESFEVVRARPNASTLQAPPRAYVEGAGRFFFSLGPGEDPTLLPGLTQSLMVASDYPHPGCTIDCAASWTRKVKALTPKARAAVLRENGLRAFSVGATRTLHGG